LISVKADTIIALFGSIGSKSYSLGSFTVGVFDVDVVECGVWRRVLHGAGSFVRGRSGGKTAAVLNSDNVIVVIGGVFRVAVYVEGTCQSRDNHLLVVGAGIDKNGLSRAGGFA